MKFTSVAIAALFTATTSAVTLQDDCKGTWCNKGLSYDLDEATLRKAEADNVAKTHAFQGATKAHETATSEHDAAAAKAAETAAADATAAAAKATARNELTSTAHTDPSYDAKEKTHEQTVYTKWATHDAQLKAADDEIAKTHVLNRKARDLAAATAAKEASDANLKANQERVAWEKDQLERGENQDRLKFVNENTVAKTSEINGKHDERERGNGRLLKAIASF
jgi:hypothetical protein